MEFSEKALILKVGRFREIDAWVRLFSPERGVYTAVAFGGSVSRRRFCGCLDVFNHVGFKVKTQGFGRYHHLLEGRLIASHPRLRSQPERLGPAVNCLKFLEAVQFGDQGAAPAFELLTDCLRVLDGEMTPPAAFPMFFRAALTARQGFFPDHEVCCLCGQRPSARGGALFHVEEGRFFCHACPPPTRGAGVRLGPEALDLFGMLKAVPASDWAKTPPSPQASREFSQAVDRFVGYHLGLVWENGMFVRT